MKRLLIMSLLLLLTSSVIAIPVSMAFKIRFDENIICYDLPQGEDRTLQSLNKDISEVRKLTLESDKTTPFYLTFHVQENIELKDIQRLKDSLSPLGFDHFTIISKPKITEDTVILVTTGKPTEETLWFRSSVFNEVLGLRGFTIEWYTAETGCVRSTTGVVIHFGINCSDLITVYARDIAWLSPWEQHIWAAHNVVPEGKVSKELLAAQVQTQPASTHAVEDLLFKVMEMLDAGFRDVYGVSLFSHDVDQPQALKHISRFVSKDQASLLKLAKELVRVFSDRLDVRELRKLSTHAEKKKLGSNKLLQDVLAQKVGTDKARHVFGAIVGAYDMRVGDAHPTSSKISDALKLAGIDENKSFLRQGEQLISNFGQSIWWIGKLLFENPEN